MKTCYGNIPIRLIYMYLQWSTVNQKCACVEFIVAQMCIQNYEYIHVISSVLIQRDSTLTKFGIQKEQLLTAPLR